MIKEAEKHLSSVDQTLAEIIALCGPCKIKPERPYFFVLCDAIISQQVSVKAAAAIIGRFKALYEKSNPSPADILSTPDEQLQGVGISRAKTTYIKTLAEAFQSKAITPRRFQEMEDEQIIEQLVKVKGIGVWTAQMFLIFSLNRPDILPVADLGIQRAIQVNYNLTQLPKAKEMLEIAEPWKPYRSIASWYLW
ncbi:MAG: DNA-3-methyladenine glycosylase 2 family protein, partial [Blastocatellia bacterium]|nr:DNA-3-methyladenine glycosylase 2 family protein [Blastocatellia bacterium]